MQKLTAGKFRFGDIWNIRHKSTEAQVQFLLDVRGAEGFVVEALQPLLEDMLPTVAPPPGYLGDVLSASGELRGHGDMLVLINGGKAYVGTLPELLAAVRATVLCTAERFAAPGNAEDVRFRAGQMLLAIRGERPQLRAVE